jgi:hypothetical protein
MIQAPEIPFVFDYTDAVFTDGLDVGATIYDVTAGLPGTEVSFIEMTACGNGRYKGAFTGTANKSYSIEMDVYTDGTYETINENFAPLTVETQCIDVLGAIAALSTKILQSLFVGTVELSVTDNSVNLEIQEGC